MKKLLVISQLLVISFSVFADYENYNGKDVSNRVYDSGSSDFPLSLKYSTWVGANLSNSRFGTAGSSSSHNVDLTGADFTNANLTGVRFGYDSVFAHDPWVRLTDAIFTNSNISNVTFYASTYFGFTKEQLYSTANYKNKNLSGVKFLGCDLSGWDFSNQDLSSVIFDGAGIELTDTNFTDAIVSGTHFSGGFTLEQLYSTKSYKDKNLMGIYFDSVGIVDCDLTGQNLMHVVFKNSAFSRSNFTNADLRDVTWSITSKEIYVIKNTIWTDGEIKNFAMESVDDNLTIRKYVPTTTSGAMISAKIANDATLSGGAKLTLEQGAFLEVTNGKTLTVTSDGLIQIDTDLSGSTIFNVNSNSGLVFEDGAVLTVNIIDDIITSDAYTIAVISFEDDSLIAGLNNFIKDETLFLTVNGEKFNGAWDYTVKGNELSISINVPEPATYAAIFGALALAFAAYRRRK